MTMAVRVPRTDLSPVLEFLNGHLPYCTSTYTPVKLITQGLTGYDVFVDQWPDMKAVLVKPNQDALKSSMHEKCMFLFCTDENVIKDLIDRSRLLDTPDFSLVDVPSDSFNKVRGILWKTKHQSFVERALSLPLAYYTTRVQQPPFLPEGFSQRRLTPEDATTVTADFWYKNHDYCKSVKRVLEIGTFSNVGVVDSSGQLVAWSLQHISGFLGPTYVKPQYRGKGLGKYVTVVLAQSVIDRDGFCITSIQSENHISINLHERVGFKKMETIFPYGVYECKK